MNFPSHHEVARRLAYAKGPDFLFGSMVPDFVGMLRLRRTYELSDNKILARGIEFHQETDDAFDDIESVKELQRIMIKSFKLFMPQWSAAQCGRAGKDMLFDSLLMNNPESIRSYEQTMLLAARDEINVKNTAEPYDKFRDGIVRLQQAGLPDYTDTYSIANRLHRRISPLRAAFSPDLIPQLAESLEVHRRLVSEIGQAVVEETLDRLSN